MMRSGARLARVVFGLMAVLAAVCSGAERKLDLRPPQRSGVTDLAVTYEQGVLRHTSLAGGATAIEPLAVGDVIDLVLFDDTEISVVLKKELESPVGGASFIAAVERGDALMSAVVVQSEEGLQVNVQDLESGRVYTVASSRDATIVRELDPDVGEVKDSEPLVPERPAVEAAEALSAVDGQESKVVDILVAYDKGAAAWARSNGGGLDNFAQTAVAKMNVALANNGLDSSFSFRLVGTTEVLVSKSDVHQALSAIDYGEPGWAAIKTKRDEVGADVVTTLIDIGSDTGTVGVGWSLSKGWTISSFAPSAYNVCAIRSVARSHTMTHEVGHNMGAGHATAVDSKQISPGPQFTDYAAGHFFTAKGQKYHTIMAYNWDGYGNHYNEAPLFSSPIHTWQGTVAGDAKHDNARTIKETHAAVSQWRARKVPLSYDVIFSPEAGTLFMDSISVTLKPGKTGLAIRYTTDGSTPTLSSRLYSGAITLKATTTVKAATVSNGILGPVYEARYVKNDLGAALNATGLKWTTSADYPWVAQTQYAYDGLAAQSCPKFTSNNGCGKTSWLKTTVVGPKEMSFRYQKQQRTGAFRVYCDGTVLWNDVNGASAIGSGYPWLQATVRIPSGSHEIKFAFEHGSGYYSSFNGVVLDTVSVAEWTPTPEIPGAPTVSISGTTLSWAAVTGANYYKVYRSTNPYADPVAVSGWLTTRTYAVTRPSSEGTCYFYFVKAASERDDATAGPFNEVRVVTKGALNFSSSARNYVAHNDDTEFHLYGSAAISDTPYDYVQGIVSGKHSITFTKSAGSGITVKVNSMDIDKGVIVTPSTSSNAAFERFTLAISATANTSATPRATAFYSDAIEPPGLSSSVPYAQTTAYWFARPHYIYQAGVDSVAIGPTSETVGMDGGTCSVSVTATPTTASWSASASVDWIALYRTSSTGSGALGYIVKKNTTGKQRSGTITVKGVSVTRTLTVTQLATAAKPSLSSISITGPDFLFAGSNGDFEATSIKSDGSEWIINPTWSIDSGTSYASISPQGVLTAKTVSSRQTVKVKASYTEDGVTKTATKNVMIYPTFALSSAFDNSTLEFKTGGDAEWFGQDKTTYDGSNAARSGIIKENQNSWMQTTVTGPGTFSFRWYASSESGTYGWYDYMTFSIDGVQTNRIGGTSCVWTPCSYTLGPGTHVLRWNYLKDIAADRGEDAGFVDEIVWEPDAGTVRLVIPAQSVVKLPRCESADGRSPGRWRDADGKCYDSEVLVYNPSSTPRTLVLHAEGLK